MIENIFDESKMNGLLCSNELFRYFIRKNYVGIEITNEECDEMNKEFTKYLEDLNLTDVQRENIIPKSMIDVIFNTEHPLRINGFPPAFSLHFTLFIEKMKEKAIEEGYTEHNKTNDNEK